METMIEQSDAAFVNQVDVFCNKVATYQTVLGLNPAKVINMSASRGLLVFAFKQNDVAQQYSRSYTAYKNLLRYGMDNQVLGALPAPPVYPDALPAVTVANVQAQFADIIQDCVRSQFFTEAIGKDLGILKDKAVFVPENGSPNLSGKLAQGGHPLLHAKVGKYDGFEIWKESGDGQGFKLCATALYPDFIDPAALPAPNTSVAWKYKAIYLYKGKHAGTWSSDIVVVVHGTV